MKKELKLIEKDFEKLCDLFYTNIPLFIQKQDIILSESRFYAIRSPRIFFGGVHIGNYFSTLEKMLSLWKNESHFSGKCKCGGSTVVYHFNISELSGSFAYKTCLKCGNLTKTRCDAKSIIEVSNKYKSAAVSYGPVAIRELINYLGDRNYKIATSLKDNYKGIPPYLTQGIWRKDSIERRTNG